jgi:hypothetical protein
LFFCHCYLLVEFVVLLQLRFTSLRLNLNGAHDQDRTDDLILTKDVLYQLSYMGTVKSGTVILIPKKRQKTIAPAFYSQKS